MKKLAIAVLSLLMTTATFAQTENSAILHASDSKTKEVIEIPSSFNPPLLSGYVTAYKNGLTFCGRNVLYLAINQSDNKNVVRSYIFYRSRPGNNLPWIPLCKSSGIYGVSKNPVVEKSIETNPVRFVSATKDRDVILWEEDGAIHYELEEHSFIAAK